MHSQQHLRASERRRVPATNQTPPLKVGWEGNREGVAEGKQKPRCAFTLRGLLLRRGRTSRLGPDGNLIHCGFAALIISHLLKIVVKRTLRCNYDIHCQRDVYFVIACTNIVGYRFESIQGRESNPQCLLAKQVAEPLGYSSR